MEEWGVGPMRQQDGLWQDMFEASWDGKVKLHNVVFQIAPHLENAHKETSTTISLGLEFGPVTSFVSKNGDIRHGEIGRVISFKVFDSHGKFTFGTMEHL
jgi:hypothetical protein